MSWLLDTNVASQLVRPRPNERVIHGLSRHAALESRLFISAVTIAEFRRGALLLISDPAAQSRVLRWMESEVPLRFRNRVLAFDQAVAERWADMCMALPKGYVQPTFDSIIAATALHHALVLVTRNVGDFRRVPGLKLENPFT